MRVLKFGGSSVADSGRIRQVAAIVDRERADGPLVVVVSALGGVTDELVGLADAAPRDREAPDDAIDRIRDRHLAVLDDLAPDDDECRSAIGSTIDELRRWATAVVVGSTGRTGRRLVRRLRDHPGCYTRFLSMSSFGCGSR